MDGWKITWGDKSWTRDDMTAQHVALLGLIYGDDSWAPLNRTPLDGPGDLLCYLTAFVAIDEGRDALEVKIDMAQLSLDALVQAVGVDDRLPVPSGEPVDMPAPV